MSGYKSDTMHSKDFSSLSSSPIKSASDQSNYNYLRFNAKRVTKGGFII